MGRQGRAQMADDNPTTCAYERSDGTTCPGVVEAESGEMCLQFDYSSGEGVYGLGHYTYPEILVRSRD